MIRLFKWLVRYATPARKTVPPLAEYEGGHGGLLPGSENRSEE